jgi:hypothetical protein
VPKNQCQLWDLLPLLAQLKEGRLAGSRLHQLRDPVEDAPVLIRHANLGVRLDIVCGAARDNAVALNRRPIVARNPVVVLLLGLGGGGGGSGGLSLRLSLRGLCLSLQLTVLGYMMVGVLVVALRPLAGVLLLLVREEVLHWLLIRVRLRASRVVCRGQGGVGG